jgi:NAD(P)-dependent dehydrogenase (short-subunit alcohol dehydrogenase family)
MRNRRSPVPGVGWQLVTIFARAGDEVVFSSWRSNAKLKRLARYAQGKAGHGLEMSRVAMS